MNDQIYDVIRSVIGGSEEEFIPLHEPTFAGREKEYLTECIDTGWVSSVGSFVDRFESDLANYCGVKRAVAAVNGTAALHIALTLAGVEGGDEVLMPTLTFIATANAANYIGAVPHFTDSEEQTLGLDPEKLSQHLEQVAERREDGCYNIETGRRIKAVVPMHTFGHPIQIEKLQQVVREWGIVIVEDAAESLGSYVGNKHTGSYGLLSALSFNGNKVITAGGGGAILTNDDKLADRAKHLTTTAKVSHRWRFNHDMVGYNLRMPNLNAALIVAQLEQLPEFLRIKRQLAESYADAFTSVAGVRFVCEPEGCTSNYWLNTLVLEKGNEGELEGLLQTTNDRGIMTRPVWDPMHNLAMYADCPKSDLSVAESLSQRVINLPSGVKIAQNV